MTKRMELILGPGQVAVVTGAAKGIGAALARFLASRGMSLVLFDRDIAALQLIVESLPGKVLAVHGDVTVKSDVQRLHDLAVQSFGSVNLLINNAGIMQKAGPWDAPEEWAQIMSVNFFSLLATQHLFVPGMIASGQPAAIVNLGSKEGITTPPGNAAYSVAKAGVRVLTEQLEHELRSVTGGQVSAHLLVPGYTWTPMNFPGLDQEKDEKPSAPWTAEQLVDYAIAALLKGDFYIICPDNEVSKELDAKRLQWAADDLIRNRPALSRWHKDWKGEFTEWIKN